MYVYQGIVRNIFPWLILVLGLLPGVYCFLAGSTQKMEPTRSSETSGNEHYTPGISPKTRTNHSDHGESFKSRNIPPLRNLKFWYPCSILTPPPPTPRVISHVTTIQTLDPLYISIARPHSSSTLNAIYCSAASYSCYITASASVYTALNSPS